MLFGLDILKLMLYFLQMLISFFLEILLYLY